MAKNQQRRESDPVLKRDVDGLAALKKIDDYEPSKDECKLPALEAAQKKMVESQEKEAQDTAAAKNSRDASVAAEWAFHNLMLGAKDQVKAQYGSDSDELQSVGLKKKSAYKVGRRKAA